MHTTIWAYPWDLCDEGFEVIHHIKDAGLNAISLASAYHTFEMLRPHLPQNNCLQITQAAVYFHPNETLFKQTLIKPQISPLMGKADWWAQAANEATKAGIDLIAWTVFLHNSYLATTYPSCAEVTCTHDISTCALCPTQPDVRAYAVALAQNLAQEYGISLLECESLNFYGFGHTHYHVKYGLELGAGGRFLMSLCFCEACTQKASQAGIDAHAIARASRKKLQNAFQTGHPVLESPDELTEFIPNLKAYLSLRQQTVTTLLQEVKNAAGVPTSFILMGNRFSSGIHTPDIAQSTDYVETLSYTADPSRTGQTISDLLPDLKTPEQLIVGLQAYPPASPNVQILDQNVNAALSQGVRRLSFYNYGIMPLPNLQWIAQIVQNHQNG